MLLGLVKLRQTLKQAAVHVNEVEGTDHVVGNLSLEHLEEIYHALGKEQFLVNIRIFQNDNYALFVIQHDLAFLNLHDLNFTVLRDLLGSLTVMAFDHEVLVTELFFFKAEQVFH